MKDDDTMGQPRAETTTPPAAPREALVAALETAVDMGDHFRLRSDQYEIAYRATLQRPAAQAMTPEPEAHCVNCDGTGYDPIDEDQLCRICGGTGDTE